MGCQHVVNVSINVPIRGVELVLLDGVCIGDREGADLLEVVEIGRLVIMGVPKGNLGRIQVHAPSAHVLVPHVDVAVDPSLVSVLNSDGINHGFYYVAVCACVHRPRLSGNRVRLHVYPHTPKVLLQLAAHIGEESVDLGTAVHGPAGDHVELDIGGVVSGYQCIHNVFLRIHVYSRISLPGAEHHKGFVVLLHCLEVCDLSEALEIDAF